MLTSILKTTAVLSLLATPGWAAVINVTTGTTIARTWDEIKTANYAYAPMQTYTASSNTTKVYMPYGNLDLCYGSTNINLVQDGWTRPLFANANSANPCSLTFAFKFDTNIDAFSLVNSEIFAALGAGNMVTIEYATTTTLDVPVWQPLWSAGSGTYNGLTNSKTGLSTKDLYLRYSTSGTAGKDFYMNLVGAGRALPEPDGSYDNFVGNMNTLSVTVPEPAALSLLVLGGLALFRRRPRA
jgi:hypothetical protein